MKIQLEQVKVAERTGPELAVGETVFVAGRNGFDAGEFRGFHLERDGSVTLKVQHANWPTYHEYPPERVFKVVMPQTVVMYGTPEHETIMEAMKDAN